MFSLDILSHRMSENDFECLASTGVNTPGTMFSNSLCETFNAGHKRFANPYPAGSAPASDRRRLTGRLLDLASGDDVGTSLTNSLVTRPCDVLASTNYAATHRQLRTEHACLELRCTAGLRPGGERDSCLLPPQRETPLHVGVVRHRGFQRW